MRLTRIGSTNAQTMELANGTTILISYSTPVAAQVPGVGFFRTKEHFSSTTSKHINKWLRSENVFGLEEEKEQDWFDGLLAGAPFVQENDETKMEN